MTALAGLACAAGYAVLAWLARQPGEPSLTAFLALVAVTAAPVFLLYVRLGRAGIAPPVSQLLFWAVAFRLCGLIGGPIYEDDFYRYLWDGYRFATAGTPYGVAPEAFFADPAVPAAFRGLLDGINNPELATIYGPVTQFVFLIGFWIKPGSILALQSLLVAVDLVTLALLLRLAPARNVLLYAWCPLVVKEIAFTAHPDGIGVCLALAALALSRPARGAKPGIEARAPVASRRLARMAGRRRMAAAICLGLAVGAKVPALILAPFVLFAGAGRVRRSAVAAGSTAFLLTLATLYAPFALTGGTDLASLRVFVREWEFNSAIFGLASAMLPAFAARATVGLAFGAFAVWCFTRWWRAGGGAACTRAEWPVPRGDWLFGALLALSPVINPWYALWVLPFAAIYPSRWAWTASVAVFLSYITGLNLADYSMPAYAHPAWVRPVEFGSILVALGWDARSGGAVATGRSRAGGT